jgi:hypothetical protein
MDEFLQNVNNWNYVKYKERYDDVKHIRHPELLLRHALTVGINECREFIYDKHFFFPKRALEKQKQLITDCKIIRPIKHIRESSANSDFFEMNYTVYITRNMNNTKTSEYWKHSYSKIRKLYEKIKIVVIDDNSLLQYIENDVDYKDVEFFYSKDEKSECYRCMDFTCRGELLPFYYFHTYGSTPYALFIHDSVFINRPIHEFAINKEYISLWHFVDKSYRLGSINKYVLNKFGIDEKDLNGNWNGVFGGMCMLSKQYLHDLNNEYNFFKKLLPIINSREQRMELERIIGILHTKKTGEVATSIYGNINVWCEIYLIDNWGMSWETYKENSEQMDKLDIVKVWTGR